MSKRAMRIAIILAATVIAILAGYMLGLTYGRTHTLTFFNVLQMLTIAGNLVIIWVNRKALREERADG